MKFEEVLPALREGKKIKRKKWDKGYYYRMIYKNGNNVIVNNYGEVVVVLEDIFADDWEIVEEVKESKKIKLRDLTEEQFNKWAYENCEKYDDKCKGCPFQKVYCDRNPNIDDWWIRNKDLYSDKFLDQEIEVEEE